MREREWVQLRAGTLARYAYVGVVPANPSRDDPADADVYSHRLLILGRVHPAGSRPASTPGSRSARRCCARSRTSSAGRWTRPARQEVNLPIAQPLELWERSGRNALYGDLMFRLTDRKDTAYCLSPTVEEVVTTPVAQEYGSYRDLPGEPLPDQLEVPRRDPGPRRPAARP